MIYRFLYDFLAAQDEDSQGLAMMGKRFQVMYNKVHVSGLQGKLLVPTGTYKGDGSMEPEREELTSSRRSLVFALVRYFMLIIPFTT